MLKRPDPLGEIMKRAAKIRRSRDVYVLMSHAGEVVAVYSVAPDKARRDHDYGKYLNKDLEPGTADWNCHVERWPIDAGHTPNTHYVNPT